MYYEEQIIDNKLYYRTSPAGKWFLIDYAKLLDRYIEVRNEVKELEDKIRIVGLKN